MAAFPGNDAGLDVESFAGLGGSDMIAPGDLSDILDLDLGPSPSRRQKRRLPGDDDDDTGPAPTKLQKRGRPDDDTAPAPCLLLAPGCPICLEDVAVPPAVLVPCGHINCGQCVLQQIEWRANVPGDQDGVMFQCALCKGAVSGYVVPPQLREAVLGHGTGAEADAWLARDLDFTTRAACLRPADPVPRHEPAPWGQPQPLMAQAGAGQAGPPPLPLPPVAQFQPWADARYGAPMSPYGVLGAAAAAHGVVVSPRSSARSSSSSSSSSSSAAAGGNHPAVRQLFAVSDSAAAVPAAESPTAVEEAIRWHPDDWELKTGTGGRQFYSQFLHRRIHVQDLGVVRKRLWDWHRIRMSRARDHTGYWMRVAKEAMQWPQQPGNQ